MMKQILASLILTVFSSAIYSQNWSVEDIKVFDQFDDMEYIFQEKGDTVYIVNFWATWCGPCVKELPYFEALHNAELDVPVKITLVSLDFTKHLETKLVPFLNKKEIHSEVVLLDDPKANDWIDRVDESWSGAIPITVFYSGEQRLFFEKEFHSTEELTSIINQIYSSNEK